MKILSDKNVFDAALDRIRYLFDEFPNVVACISGGYGRAGRIFYEAGKRFVMSDYNASCIGHIAKEWQMWVKPDL